MDKKGNKCCDPFKTNHSKFLKMYDVTEALINNAKNHGLKIKIGDFICALCRQRIKKPVRKQDESPSSSQRDSASQSSESSQPSQSEQPIDMDVDEIIGPVSSSESTKDTDSDENLESLNIDVNKVKKAVNELLLTLHINAIDDMKLRGKKYQMEIVKKLTHRMTHVLFPEAKQFRESEKIMEQLKEKFNETTSRNTKIKILSIFPKDWGFPKFREVLGEAVTKHMVYQTKKLVEKNGILCDTKKKSVQSSLIKILLTK